MTAISDVSALYVDPTGPYPGLLTDWYSKSRDARTYAGPNPVVAHPPCGPWGKLREQCTQQDGSLAIHAVKMVLTYGGVLEHPAHSRLWIVCRLPTPGHQRPGEMTLEVDQARFGHNAPKLTWVYICRPSELNKGRENEAFVSPPEIPEETEACGRIQSMSRRRRGLTPLRFAQWLIEIARSTQ